MPSPLYRDDPDSNPIRIGDYVYWRASDRPDDEPWPAEVVGTEADPPAIWVRLDDGSTQRLAADPSGFVTGVSLLARRAPASPPPLPSPEDLLWAAHPPHPARPEQPTAILRRRLAGLCRRWVHSPDEPFAEQLSAAIAWTEIEGLGSPALQAECERLAAASLGEPSLFETSPEHYFARQSWDLLRAPPTALRLAHALTAETWQECRLVLQILADRAVWDAFATAGPATLELRPPLHVDTFGPGGGLTMPGFLHAAATGSGPASPQRAPGRSVNCAKRFGAPAPRPCRQASSGAELVRRGRPNRPQHP